MSTRMSSLGSSTAAPITQPSKEKGLTKLQIIFTPGGSQVIKDNLFRVYENREYRIYGAYVTAVTAFRSGLEIIPLTGILLLNTATWFVDITSPRGDVITIIARDFSDILHCIKATIALPFFAIAGLIFPSDVFGLFKNMPGIQTKVEILDGKALFADVKAKIASEEIDLTATAEELSEVQIELKETDELLTLTKAQLEAVLQQIENSKDAATEAASLTTQVQELTERVAKLSSEEATVSAKLVSIRDEITRLGPALEVATASNAATLESLKSQHTAKTEELQKIQDHIKQTGEKQTSAQAALDRLMQTVQDLTSKAATLTSDVESRETAKLELIEQERVLIAKIQFHKDELKEHEAAVIAAKEKSHLELAEIKEQIGNSLTYIRKRQAQLDTLERNLKDTNERRDALDKQCKDLEFTTLPGLNVSKEELGRKIESLDAKKTTLGTEIAALQEELSTAKARTDSIPELESMITELQLRKRDFSDKVLPELEDQKTTLEQRKAALEKAVSAEQQKLEGVRTSHADTLKKLDSLKSTLELMRAEQASLEQTLESITQALKETPASSAAAAGSSSSPKKSTVTALKDQLSELGVSITEKTKLDTALKVSIAGQESALIEKTQAVASLTEEASLLDEKVNRLKAEENEVASRLSLLISDITRLEAKEKDLKNVTAAFLEQVKISTESLNKIAAQHKELEPQMRAAEEKKDAANKDYKAVSDQVAAARKEKAEIQSVIDGLKPNLDSLKSSLEALEAEQERISKALPGLKAEEQTLINQIALDKQELARLKETLTRTQENHTGEMQKLEEARTQVREDKTRLENEIEAKKRARDALQSEFDRLTASTEALRGQKTTLEETVRAAEAAQLAVIARTSEKTKAHEMLQAQTVELNAKVLALTLKSVAQAEANQKFEAEFETHRAALEESLRKREQEAVVAQEAKLQEIRLASPAKAKLNSPTRTIASSPETVAEDLKTAFAQLKHAKKELAQAKAEKKQVQQETAEYAALITQGSKEAEKVGKECIRLYARKKQLKEELAALAPASAAATSETPAGVNGGTNTAEKQ